MELAHFAAAIGTGMTGATIAIERPLAVTRGTHDKVAADILTWLAEDHSKLTYADVEQVLLTALFWLQLWGALEFSQGTPETRNREEQEGVAP